MIITTAALTALGIALLHALGLGTAGALLGGHITVGALLAGGHVARKALVIRVLHDLTKLNKLQGSQQCQCQKATWQSQQQWQFPKWNWTPPPQPSFGGEMWRNQNWTFSNAQSYKPQQRTTYYAKSRKSH